MPLDIPTRLQAAMFPLVLLLIAVACTLVTFLEIALKDRRPFEIFSKSKWRHRAFEKFWILFGPMTHKVIGTEVKQVLAQANGVVLEVGPGSGLTVKYFDKTNITHIYGIEPNTHLHAALREEVKRCGLEDIYTIVGCGVEDLSTLHSYKIYPGTIDTVACVHVLCSVPNLKDTAHGIYDLIRPGGQMLVYEHVLQKKGILAIYLQALFDIPWATFLDGCNLRRPTDEVLKQTGMWENVELEESINNKGEYDVIPNVKGRFVKAT
ncbi:S-adenosyl-L-methionine-dependent methyltransferase [Kalaharituber pfeilii]|nr:S-adenosyl-L-methionine-dependent methyltransferase [Kalaharituber pfeilii]